MCECAPSSLHCKLQSTRRFSWFQYLKDGDLEKMIDMIIETEMLNNRPTLGVESSEYIESLNKARMHQSLLANLPSTYDFLRIHDDSQCATLQCAVRLQKLEIVIFLLDLLQTVGDGLIILNAGNLYDRMTPLMDARGGGKMVP
jgi:hypothetical protein